MKQFKMNFGSGKTIGDGAHRHSREKTTINVADEALNLIAKHLPDCPNRPDSFNADSQVPLQFIIEKSGRSSVVCGYCKQNLGQCEITEVK